jgi:hypothetical protein
MNIVCIIVLHYERLDLCRQLYAYVISTSPPEYDLEYFDRLTLVAQGVYTITTRLWKGKKGTRRTKLAQKRIQWRALAVLSFQVPVLTYVYTELSS